MTTIIDAVKPVLTHVVTGFLGVGKTTLIQSLIKRRPLQERWGILVNEFGEVGVDGALLAGQGVAIKEVPGGCICCAAGVPMRVALVRLLREQKLDRLIIEPTGLGHASDILSQLQSDEFAGRLRLGATLTLVDPHKLMQPKYRHHPIFASQLSVADVLVATKIDQADAAALDFVQEFADTLRPKPLVILTRFGDLPLNVLDTPPSRNSPLSEGTDKTGGLRHYPAFEPQILDASDIKPIAANGYRQKSKQANHYLSLGWHCGRDVTFDEKAVFDWFFAQAPLRAKAVIKTSAGIWVLNVSDGQITSSPVDLEAIEESRLELIFECDENFPNTETIKSLAQNFLKCVTAPSFLQKVE